MNNEYSFNIDNSIINSFSNSIEYIKDKYNIKEYYELTQIHSTIVNIVDNNYINKTEGDALITNMVNIPLVIKTADCIPILLYDNKNKVIAAVHSGWKGTLNNIVINTLNTMIDKYNCKKENISAYLYPSIRKCYFEVEDDVYQMFKDKITNIDKYTTKKVNKYYIDLQQIVIDNLKENSITNIFDSNICTYCHNDTYHSYRYNHTDKRNYLLVILK